MVAAVCNSRTAIRREAHIEMGLGQRFARRNNRGAQALVTNGIATEINLVSGQSGIQGNYEPDPQANLARDGSGDSVIQWPYTLALNRARQISEGGSAAKASGRLTSAVHTSGRD